MAGSNSLLILSLSLVVLCINGCLASSRQGAGRVQYHQQDECRIQNLNPLEPGWQIQHEAGVTEVWDSDSDPLQCAGVAVTRHLIEPRGLLLPLYHNVPMLAYVLRGRGIMGTTYPGCLETYQSFQQSQQEGERQSEKYRDQHQKIQHIRQGDLIAVRAGVAHWAYNHGNDQLVLVVLHDIGNYENQLDQNLRKFFLAGNPQQHAQSIGGQRGQNGEQRVNIFQGFDLDVLAEAFDINPETARNLQGENDNRGSIVRVEKEFQVISPSLEEAGQRERGPDRSNGLEESICTGRIKVNIDDPERSDVYAARGGRISTLNSQTLPILSDLQLSAERGVLYKNAMVAPYWNINAHSIIYITKGNGRVQIVGGDSKRPAYNGKVRQGQVLIVPQNFAVMKQAGDQGLEWVAFKTNDLAKTSPLAGRTSVIRALPEDVLVNAYQIPREEARRLKNNRQEFAILSPRSRSRYQPPGRASAWPAINLVL